MILARTFSVESFERNILVFTANFVMMNDIYGIDFDFDVMVQSIVRIV